MIKSKALHLTVSTALLLSMAAVAGCGNTDGNVRTNNAGNNGRVGVNNTRNQTAAGQHDLTNLKYSKQLSEKVSNISGAGPAHVFVTDRNAYVALPLHNQNGGTGTGAGTGLGGTGGAGTGMGMGGTGTGTGMGGGMTGGTGGTTGMGMNRNNIGGTTGNGANDTGTVGLLRDMTTNRTTDTRGFGVRGTANGGGFGGTGFDTMNNTRGNGLMGTNGARTGGAANNQGTQHEVPDHVRNEITSKIQKTAPHIKQVYITSDPAFYQHSAGYANNRPDNTTGTLAHDFGGWINRVFPMNADGADDYRARGGLIYNDRDDGWFGGNRNSR